MAIENNGKCFSKEFISSTSLLWWECHLNHKWQATSKNIKSGSWCHECSTPILTIDDCYNAAKKNNGKCLSNKYININTEYLWECGAGHQWKSSLNVVRNGNAWCYDCSDASNKKLTIEDCHGAAHQGHRWQCNKGHTLNRAKSLWSCHNLAKSKGGEFLNDEYKNNSTKYNWKCKLGHIWKASIKSIKNNVWCPKCRKPISYKGNLSIQDCIDLAAQKNGKCLSAKYINSATKYKWQCELGHIWSTSYREIKVGKWCRYCCKNATWTIEKCQDLASSINFKCLSKNIINTSTNMEWECDEGHIFIATPSAFKRSRFCYICKKPNLDKAKRLAANKGGLCVSKKFTKTKEKMFWECKMNHIFESSYNSIHNGSWCPMCAKKESKRQKLIFDVLSKKYPNYDIKYNFKGFKWLKSNKNKRLEIDIYIPELKLAIEYDGRQHFVPVRFGGIDTKRAQENLANQQERDSFKNAQIADNKQAISSFIRFNYKEKLSAKYIIDKIERALWGKPG